MLNAPTLNGKGPYPDLPRNRTGDHTDMADKLSADDRSALLAAMSGWAESDDGKSIEKTFKFDGFEAAWGFMTRVAIKAQTMDHHPDWSNAYSTVEVSLSSHDVGGVTELDIELAKYMDVAASNTGMK